MIIYNYNNVATDSVCRAVAEEQRSLALGVQSVLWRLLGSIPGPLLFGVIFDSSCNYWQFECGRRGNCWVYNNTYISVRAFGISTSGVLINTVFMLLCWIFYPPVPCVKGNTTTTDKGAMGSQNQEEKGGRMITNPTFDPVEEGEMVKQLPKISET